MRAKAKMLAPLLAVLMAAVFVTGSALESYATDTVSIKIAGARVKDPWYAFSQALAQFINKKSKWLRAEAVATSGLSANIELIREKPQDYIGLAPTSTTLHARPGHAWGEARKTYTGARFIANLTTMTQIIATYDPKIKSIKDLAGKTVDVGQEGRGQHPGPPGHPEGLRRAGQGQVDLYRLWRRRQAYDGRLL